MIEKIYHQMNRIGISNIVFGVFMIIIGIISIVGGNSLFTRKNNLIF